MSKAKLLVLATFAVFVLTAPPPATAGAGGQWMVEGTSLAAGASEELASTALVLTTGELKILTANFGFECVAHTAEIEGGKLVGPDGILIKKLTFHECRGEEPCPLEGSTISTVPIHGLASLDLPGSLNAYILLLPETKNTLTTIKFVGATCSLFGVQPITGDVSILVHEASHEKLLHLGLAFSLKGALKVGSNESDLRGLSFDLALKSDKNWSFL